MHGACVSRKTTKLKKADFLPTMTNMYGYNDYHGPLTEGNEFTSEDEDEDDDPLRAGKWMEGDSLAPPCGTAVPTIHKLLEFASVSSNDVVYDLGCGDGRVCLEALVKFNASQCVGVEVEQDLVERFQFLIDDLPVLYSEGNVKRLHAIHADLREILDFLVELVESKDNSTDHSKPWKQLPAPTVLVLYLLPESIQELEADLLKLVGGLPNFRLICNTWGLSSVKPFKKLQVAEESGAASTVFRLYDKNVLQT